MKKHTKIYFSHFGYTIADFIECEVCSSKSVDIHHIEQKGMGGSKTKDFIENLIALCRNCHVDAHANEIPKWILNDIVKLR
jgi:5-methylcytosine-specific restriction endonuclease McrA